VKRPWDSEPTPRTDEASAEWLYAGGDEIEIVTRDFARNLERRLRAAERALFRILAIREEGTLCCDDAGIEMGNIAEAHLAAAREEDQNGN